MVLYWSGKQYTSIGSLKLLSKFFSWPTDPHFGSPCYPKQTVLQSYQLYPRLKSYLRFFLFPINSAPFSFFAVFSEFWIKKSAERNWRTKQERDRNSKICRNVLYAYSCSVAVASVKAVGLRNKKKKLIRKKNCGKLRFRSGSQPSLDFHASLKITIQDILPLRILRSSSLTKKENE